jgi:hypothetical protein
MNNMMPLMKREHSLIYMRVLKSVIITDPLFSQPFSTTFLLLEDMIPSNPPHISHIS